MYCSQCGHTVHPTSSDPDYRSATQEDIGQLVKYQQSVLDSLVRRIGVIERALATKIG